MSARMISPVLVGREEQLAALRDALRQAPAAVLIGGEAGIGKSRLVSEFAAEAGRAGARVLAGGCLDLGADGLPFAPFAAMLRELARELGADGVSALLPGQCAREFARLLPEFGEPDRESDRAIARARLFEQMLTLLERLAEPGPVVLIIEDAHWADRSTRELMSFLIGSQQVLAGVLIIITYRSDELHRTHPLRPVLAELGRLAWVDRIDLTRLDRLRADELVAAITGREPEPRLTDEIYRRAEGNPLFMEELLDCGCISAELPESLRDLLFAAVRRLPEDTQEALRAASAGGQRTGHALLAAVTGLDGDELARRLRPAVAANVLVADETGYAFRHALIREAVYDDLLPGERTRLHTRFAEVLGSDAGLVTPGRSLIEQAHHWYYAHDTTWALISAWDAVPVAANALAHGEQLTLLSRVLELWDKVPDAAARIGAAHVAVLEQAAAAAEIAGDPDRGAAFASAALQEVDAASEPARAALLLETRATLNHRGSGQGDPAADLRAALELLPPGVDDAARSRVLISEAKCLAERYGPQARAATEEALLLSRRAGDTATQVTALARLAVIHSHAGDDAAALELFVQARALAVRAGAHRQLLLVDVNESHVLEGMGEHERAAQVARAGIESARQHGLARSTGTFLATNVAEPLMSLGRWDEAVKVTAHALALSPPQPNRNWLRLLAGEIALRRGDLAAARTAVAAVQAAPARTRRSRDAQYQLPLVRLEAELTLAEGRHAAALDIVAATIGRSGIEADPRYTWALLVTGARICAAAMASAVADRDLARRAETARQQLRLLAGKIDAIGPVQAASRHSFLAQAYPDPGGELNSDNALSRWDAAARAWELVDQPYDTAVAMVRAAGAALAAGDRDGAGQRLRRAARLADELRAIPLSEEIQGLARSARLRLGTGPPEETGALPRMGLTPREFDVLRLVASGRSNREIATTLFISPKTASVHVSNILAKLGVSSRGEAAAAAHQSRLFDPDLPRPT